MTTTVSKGSRIACRDTTISIFFFRFYLFFRRRLRNGHGDGSGAS